MNMKKTWKRFFSLDRRHAEGFTLVELIVVIAILAILGGVAVPAYSGYVEKANKQADISLASEIKHALVLAHYAGTLAPGTSVVVSYGAEPAVTVNEAVVEGYSATSGHDAMVATFGEGYAESLELKYSDWDVGVAGDPGAMEVVKNSNFTPDSMDGLLSQVQLVVDEAAGYLSKAPNITLNPDIVDLMNKNGVAYESGDALTESTGMAAANAYVYLVGNELANLDLESEDATQIAKNNAFISAWTSGDFSTVGNEFDTATKAAAEYASIYALAMYIDKQTAGTENATSFSTDMDVAGDPRDVADSVLSSIKNSQNNAVTSAYTTYQNENIAMGDMVSFLTYMQGLSSSSDALMGKTDLTQGQYFTDGYVAGYVNNYIDLGAAVSANGNSGSSIAFIYTGEGEIVQSLPDLF